MAIDVMWTSEEGSLVAFENKVSENSSQILHSEIDDTRWCRKGPQNSRNKPNNQH